MTGIGTIGALTRSRRPAKVKTQSICSYYVYCEYSSPMKKLSLYKLGFVGLVVLYSFVFCVVDLFHTEDYRVGEPHGQVSSPDTCPACMFKASTSSTQPVYTDLILPEEMGWILVVTDPTILLSNKPACRASIRAPPSNTTS